MVRITLSHINMHGPLQFPAKKVQIFVEDHNLPKENLTASGSGITRRTS